MVFALGLLIKNQPWGPPRIWMGPDRTVGHGPDITELLCKERQLGTGVKSSEVLQGVTSLLAYLRNASTLLAHPPAHKPWGTTHLSVSHHIPGACLVRGVGRGP